MDPPHPPTHPPKKTAIKKSSLIGVKGNLLNITQFFRIYVIKWNDI